MGIFAVIDQGQVENIIKAESGFSIFGKTIVNVEQLTPRPGVGHLYNGSVFTENVTARKRAMRVRLRAIRNQRRNAGLTVQNKIFQTDDASLQNVILAALRVATGRETSDITWRTADNSDVTLTPAQFGQLLDLVEIYIRAVMRHAHTLNDSIVAAADITALNAVDISAGWPDNE